MINKSSPNILGSLAFVYQNALKSAKETKGNFVSCFSSIWKHRKYSFVFMTNTPSYTLTPVVFPEKFILNEIPKYLYIRTAIVVACSLVRSPHMISVSYCLLAPSNRAAKFTVSPSIVKSNLCSDPMFPTNA